MRFQLRLLLPALLFTFAFSSDSFAVNNDQGDPPWKTSLSSDGKSVGFTRTRLSLETSIWGASGSDIECHCWESIWLDLASSQVESRSRCLPVYSGDFDQFPDDGPHTFRNNDGDIKTLKALAATVAWDEFGVKNGRPHLQRDVENALSRLK